MRYLGSKRRIAKHILPLILKDRTPKQYYVEPFAGGLNSFVQVGGLRLANDINKYVIAMFQAVAKGWVPPSNITEDEYKTIRDNKDAHPPELVGFVGIGCAFGGKWFGGYARGKNAKGQWRNYADESQRHIMQLQAPYLKDATFSSVCYTDMQIPNNSIIYCDPPYANTTKGYAKNHKDTWHVDFWQWCRDMVKQGHTVFVSEYTAPNDALLLWQQDIGINVHTDACKQVTRTEKLFTLTQEDSVC